MSAMSSSAATPQSPFFAAADPDVAYAAVRPKINLDVEPGGSCVRARPEWVDVGHAGLSGEQRRQRGLPSGEVRGAEMEVAQRHIQGRMSEEELHGVDIDAGLVNHQRRPEDPDGGV